MTQKFIDKDGLKVLWNQISLKDYPNNETLMAVIDAIDETKANKDEIVQADWNQTDENKLDFIKNKPFYDTKHVFDYKYDGSLQNKEWVALPANDAVKWVKIANEVPTKEEMVGGRLEGEGVDLTNKENAITEDMFIEGYYDNSCWCLGFFIAIGCHVDTYKPTWGSGSTEFPTFTKGLWVLDGLKSDDPTLSAMVTRVWKESEEGGVIKQLDEKFIPDSIARVKDISTISSVSWNDLTDKPFYDESKIVLQWDGNPDNLSEVLSEEGDGARISIGKYSEDISYTKADLIGSVLTVSAYGEIQSIEITEENIAEDENGNIMIYEGMVMIVKDATSEIMPSPGVWTFSLEDIATEVKIYATSLVTSGEIKQLDEKFIPNSVAKIDNISWNNLKDKPFDDNIRFFEWPGFMDSWIEISYIPGFETLDENNNVYCYYKVSEKIYSFKDIVGSSGIWYDRWNSISKESEIVNETNTYQDPDGKMFSILKGSAMFILEEYTTEDGQIFSPGIWVRDEMHNEDGMYLKSLDSNAPKTLDDKYISDNIARSANVLTKQEQELTTEEVEQIHKNLNLENLATAEQVEALYQTLSSDRTLRFYCIEDVSVNLNGIITTYPANSNVEVKFLETDEFEIIPTSNNSILALNGYPGALDTFYPWLEGVKQFSNILFDMNPEDMYMKWNQGHQGSYKVQYAQYLNCIFWSDNPYISEVTKRTNYTLYYSSQLPLCYSSIPDNTFKSFYLAFNVNSDPNWGNKAYRDSFAKATWATQVFSYYGARTIGIFGHDDPDFNITLPKDCRGLMYAATAIENAGTFDAVNVTNFGAKSGSWREAFGECSSLRNLYIKNLKVGLNISWSPINYDSISFIIAQATNANAITISVSPYTYNLLSQSDFDLAASKNITIELLTTNYVEDRRLSSIPNKADKSYVDERLTELINSAPDTLDTIGELATAFTENKDVVDALNEAIITKANQSDVLIKTEQTLTDEELSQVRKNLKFIGKDVEGQTFTINGEEVVASSSAEIFGDYDTNIAVGQWSIAEGSGTLAKGRASHVEGAYGQALNDGCHVEGYGCKATGYWSHAEGEMTIVSSYASHAEGSYCTLPDKTKRYGTAAGYASHIEGGGCHATGSCSHAEGLATTVSGAQSHAEGRYTIAAGGAQHVEGIANVEDAEGKYIHIAGNGTFDNRSNAYTLDWDGNGCYAGNVQATGFNLGGFAAFNYDPVTGSIVITFAEESE